MDYCSAIMTSFALQHYSSSIIWWASRQGDLQGVCTGRGNSASSFCLLCVMTSPPHRLFVFLVCYFSCSRIRCWVFHCTKLFSQALEREGMVVCVPVIPSREYCVETVSMIYASLSPFLSSFNLYKGVNAFPCPDMDTWHLPGPSRLHGAMQLKCWSDCILFLCSSYTS